MYPILFHFGSVNVYAYGLMIAIAFFVGLRLASRDAKQYGMTPQLLNDFALVLLIAGVVGGRFTYVAMNFEYYLSRPLSIVRVWEGGMVFYGGLVCAVVVGVLFLKWQGVKRILRVGDLCAPSLILGHAIGRIGCFLAGCCYGKSTSSWCGVVFNDIHSLAPHGVKIFPTQLYEVVGNLCIFALLWTKRKQTRFDGQLLGMYVVFYATMRFFLEFFRGDDRGNTVIIPFSITQTISLVLILVGSYYLYDGYKKIRTPH